MVNPLKLKGQVKRVMLFSVVAQAMGWGCSSGSDNSMMDIRQASDSTPSDSRQEETGVADAIDDVLVPEVQVDAGDVDLIDLKPGDGLPDDTHTPDIGADNHDVGGTDTIEPVQPKVPPHSVVVPVGGGGTMKSSGFKARLSVGAPVPSGISASSNSIITIGIP